LAFLEFLMHFNLTPSMYAQMDEIEQIFLLESWNKYVEKINKQSKK